MIGYPSTFDLRDRKKSTKELEFVNDLRKFTNGIVQPVSIGNKVIVIAKNDSFRRQLFDL